MKTSPVIRAYLLRGALYLLLLLGACTIPLALAQRNAAERSDVKASPAIGVSRNLKCSCRTRNCRIVIPPIPAAPAIILYDQTNNPAPTPPPPPSNGVITSQDYEPEFDNYDSFAADDFVVPAGQIWNITEMDVIGESSEPPAPPDSFHVFFYADSGTLPGTLVASRLANPYSGFVTFVITLTSPVTLAEGTYWVSVQAREDFTAPVNGSGAIGWLFQTSGAAWQNPGGGFGTSAPLGAARLPAVQRKTGRTNYSVWLGQ